MDIKVSGDIKTVKMFRRLEEFLDREELAGMDMIDFQNAETGRVFAVVLTPAAFERVSDYIDALDAELNEAMDTIARLEDDHQLLAIIDAQNEVLMGRVAVDEVSPWANASSAEKAECPCKTTEASSESPHEDKDNVIISAQEYEELLNLRRKREDNHKQLSSMDAKLKEYKKSINTLQASRDQWHVIADQRQKALARSDRGAFDSWL